MTILPMTHGHASEEEDEQRLHSQLQQPDVMFLRSSFVGDLFLDPCFFFAALPHGHAAKLRQQKPMPQQIPISLPVRCEADQAGKGQPQRANGAGFEGQLPASGTQKGSVKGIAEGQGQKANDQEGPGRVPASNGDQAADQGQKHRGKRKRKAEGQGPQRAGSSQQPEAGQKADLPNLSPQRADSEGMDSPEQASPDTGPASMLINIDIRQSISNKTEIK